MSALARGAVGTRSRLKVPQRTFASAPASAFGRTAAYRRISSQPEFHSQASVWQQAKPKEEATSREESRAASEQSGQEDPSATGKEDGRVNEEGAKSEKESEGDKEGEKDGEKDGEKKAPPPPPHGDKTPWQVFTETLQTEFKASKEWNESTKALASGYTEFTQNEKLQKARSVYSQASDVASSSTATAFKKTGRVIGSSSAWVWNLTVVRWARKGLAILGIGLERVTRPLRETQAYKSVKNTIDDGSSFRYGGWVEKEERRRLREEREQFKSTRRTEVHEEDINAGTNVTLHKDAKWKESWRDFRDTSPVMQSIFSIKSTYQESENPLITTARSISDRVAGFFAETETATVIKKFREMDPNFQSEPFLQEMREYILPEVLDAYVKGDVETLKLWLSAAQFSVYSALMQQYTTAGLKSDGRILDIRNVDILSARLLDPGEIPVFIISCRTQEVHVYKNAKSGELMAGMDDKVQQVTYAIGITRIPEDVNNPETRGWRLIELQKSARDYL
ncbi:TIM44 subunit of mitochondria import inner membrane translocase [Eremomyces bilateralis CBS 781.70]|uniref:Mitochondrial import inner membrane translocase subunit TIM44 n=1 Tax=Eremomyces bilateralis CBS 781.70 TaxID=1392243 RepID=A0A6G1G8S2_9PEZI|nr:TIM44 subunit of mitochondria import inner membrane translocase [Eremomyces bilateralis CBS 781.70]KAF1814321.1 TIM44 subunit of mitochondria import inner membrane translocase [Eremomyces bilateralis CBS 781.70]